MSLMPKKRVRKQPKKAVRKPTYGIGEWFMKPIANLSRTERLAQARVAKKRSPTLTCLAKESCAKTNPKAVPATQRCTKRGGVCSIQLYVQGANGKPLQKGPLVVTCPVRFLQDALIFNWIGSVVLGTKSPVVVKEVEFLEVSGETSEEAKEIGYIDNILVDPSAPTNWCGLELQAVYFSGASMGKEFDAIKGAKGDLIFPFANRHPDFRSSGPKRLMPQLQIKVPSLRRWGKKMVVVVDQPFFDSLGKMIEVDDISNCDIAWFPVSIESRKDGNVLKKGNVRFTTLESAVEGLTGGKPATLRRFEERIFRRVKKNYPDVAIPGYEK